MASITCLLRKGGGDATALQLRFLRIDAARRVGGHHQFKVDKISAAINIETLVKPSPHPGNAVYTKFASRPRRCAIISSPRGCASGGATSLSASKRPPASANGTKDTQ
jgi:hypothetical protein